MAREITGNTIACGPDNGSDVRYLPGYQPDLLVRGLNHDLERPLLQLVGERAMSAGDFRDMVSRYAQTLSAMGAGPGTKIGILSANRPEVLVITAASLINRHILVPMHPSGSLSDHQHVLDDASINFLVFDPDRFGNRADQLLASQGRLCRFLSLGPSEIGPDLMHLAEQYDPLPLVAPRVGADEPYRLSYTGGTTGEPKAIVGTHRTGKAVVEIQMASWEWPSKIRQLVCAPLSHAGAAMFLPTLLRGGSMIILADFDVLRTLETIETYRITCVMLVPTMIYALLDHPRFDEFDLTSLETIFYGASPILPSRLQEAIKRIGPVFFQFYGQAEAPMSICVLGRSDHKVDDLHRLSSCGRAVPWVQVALLNDSLEEVLDGQLGEICVRGPLVMQGYHNRPEQTAEALAGDWLHTGDIAVRDEKGFLRIVDRKKDMIITGGFNVYPREIEDVLASHPAVALCAVIGIPDDRWGEAVTAVVVPRSGQTIEPEVLIALVRERKGAIQAPKALYFVQALPMTSLGKIDKKQLRTELGARNKEVNLA